MAQRGVMTARNPNVSYRSAAVPLDESRDSGSEGAFDSGAPELRRQRFPGWLRVAIIVAGGALSWALVAIAMGWLR
jgi:hypothetical protein